MRLEKKFITAIAATAAAVFSLGSAQAVEPIKMRWASDHSGPPHPAAIAEMFFAETVEKKIQEVKFKFTGLNHFIMYLKA